MLIETFQRYLNPPSSCNQKKRSFQYSLCARKNDDEKEEAFLPAQVNWNKFSFSNFLNTLPLISTNWLLSNKVNRAFE